MDSGKNPMNNDKSLCLYCDKAFANINDQENHVERDHKTILKSSRGKGSRKSERITKISTTEPFPGCFYCNNRKLASRSDDLESLFQHLMTAHNEVYYGCKCRVRMQDKVALVNHKKNCKIGGGGDIFDNDNYENVEEEQELLPLVEKVNKKAKTKKSQVVQCDSPSESEDTTHQYHHSRTNAINKKSENNNSKINDSNSSRKSYYGKRKNNSKLPSSSSSTISSSSKASDEYTIPITRQKLKEPVVISSPQKNRTSSNKKSSSKASSSSSSSTTSSSLISTTENKNQQVNALSSSTSSSSSSSLAGNKVQRPKASKLLLNFQNNNTNGELNENSTSSSIAIVKNEIASCEFDEDFYKNISCNIRLNLDCFIDGKADRLQNKKFIIENGGSEQMQNDTDSHQQSLLDGNHDKEIHEATNFVLSPPPFPALLTTEQYGFGDSNPNKNKRQFTKNSWKWRWDLIKKYKYVNEGGKIVKKVKQITTGLKDLSQLDMWTQLTMRSRFENINEQHQCNDNLTMRMIKTQNLDQLNGILDSRLTPEINIEQLQQMLVKEELVESDEIVDDYTEIECNEQKSDVLNTLQLKSSSNNKEINPASLSGEWARPRCFMCIDCGQEFDLMKSLNDHKNSEHPYVVSAHYEVVGRENLEQKLYKNLFLPKKALNTIDSAILINSDSKSNEASSSSQDSSNLTDLREKECTKCRKIIKYSNDIDIYRHILDCIEDKVWMQAKRRSKYRKSRRKGKKNARKIPPKAPIDQKKITSSPLMKDTVEGKFYK